MSRTLPTARRDSDRRSVGTTPTFAGLLLGLVLVGSIGFAPPAGASDWTGLLKRKGQLAPTQSLKVPLVIDRTIHRLEVSVRVAADPSIVLRHPAGRVAVDREGGVTMRKTDSGNVIVVENPDVGPWELELRGSGDYFVAARVDSSLELESFEFVRPLDAGPGGINTWALIHGVTHRPLSGEPVVGSGEPEVQAAAELSDEVASAVFTLESEDGVVLGELSLKQDPSDSLDGYVGVVPLPTVPFKVVVSGELAGPDGEEARGALYRRELETVLHARTVGVEPAHGAMAVPVAAGQRVELKYRVRNRGASATFAMSARSDLGLVTGVIPEALWIDSGEIATVTVSLQVSADAESEAQEIVTLVAKQAEDDAASNSGTITLIVVPEDQMTELGRRLTE